MLVHGIPINFITGVRKYIPELSRGNALKAFPMALTQFSLMCLGVGAERPGAA